MTDEEENEKICNSCGEQCLNDTLCCFEKELYYNLFPHTLKSDWKICDICENRFENITHKLNEVKENGNDDYTFCCDGIVKYVKGWEEDTGEHVTTIPDPAPHHHSGYCENYEHDLRSVR